MRRAAYIARVKHDKETELRYHLDHSVPQAVLKQIGIGELDAYIGSGYCVIVIGYEGDFQALLKHFMENREILEFREKLAHVLDDFPAPGYEAASAQLPLAAEAYHWTPEPSQAI